MSEATTPRPTPKRKPRKSASVSAREAEATGDGFVTVEHCGITLKVAVGGNTPIAATDAFRAGDNYEGTKQMVGEKQWKALSDAGMTVDGLDELGRKIQEALGN